MLNVHVFFLNCAVIQLVPKNDNNISYQAISSDDTCEYTIINNWCTAVLARSYRMYNYIHALYVHACLIC